MKPSLPPLRPEMALALREKAAGRAAIGFDEFMEVALYHPTLGYYTSARRRVGTAPGTDFYTASTSPLFGRLVAACCAKLLGDDPGRYTFVEIGAEPSGGVLSGVEHPFARVAEVRLGDSLPLEGPLVVFSNELFDAQPFQRFKREGGQWLETLVVVETETLAETERPAPALDGVCLPEDAPDGYRLDLPLESARLARRIADQPWHGLFLAFDYGKRWEQLAYDTPAGTARAYHRHVQGNDLLAAAGEQDLTCHICWDWICEALRGAGFAPAPVESQESFLVQHATAILERITRSAAGALDPDLREMQRLLHPAHMGRKFQALWALRPATR